MMTILNTKEINDLEEEQHEVDGKRQSQSNQFECVEVSCKHTLKKQTKNQNSRNQYFIQQTVINYLIK